MPFIKEVREQILEKKKSISKITAGTEGANLFPCPLRSASYSLHLLQNNPQSYFGLFCFYLFASLNPSFCRRCCREASRSCCSPQTAATVWISEECKEVLSDKHDRAHTSKQMHINLTAGARTLWVFFFFLHAQAETFGCWRIKAAFVFLLL